jgi:predicted metal-dependent phosphoesterase TrpH
MGKVDLHVHSTASDGKFSPAAIVSKAAALGLKVLSLADHDTVDGIAPAFEAAKAFPRLTLIPGVEISTEMPDGEVHVLGYFIDYTSPELGSALGRFRNSREIRAQKMISKLHNLGIRINWQRVQEIAGEGSIGRPHVARAMLEKGYIGSIKEAFTRYLGHDGPAYVERDKMTPLEAVELILQSDGLPVLAHPFTTPDLPAMITRLKTAGLVGIEAYYDNYTVPQIKELVELADNHGLITTGGSDYHGLDETNETMLGDVDVPEESVARLTRLASERALKMVNR